MQGDSARAHIARRSSTFALAATLICFSSFKFKSSALLTNKGLVLLGGLSLPLTFNLCYYSFKALQKERITNYLYLITP